MNKIKITADGILSIIKGIFNDAEINTTIDETDAPEEWKGKQIQEVLDCEYFTFKYRPLSTEQILEQLRRDNAETMDYLKALKRGFCSVSLGEIDRLYSKDVDLVAVPVVMQYWIQTEKYKLLESLIEDCNVSLSGMRPKVKIKDETRRAVVIFGKPVVTEIQTASGIGEVAKIRLEATITLFPNATSYSDYDVSVSFVDAEGVLRDENLPLTTLSYTSTMARKAVPKETNIRMTGNMNLGRSLAFVLVFDGHDTRFVDFIAENTLSDNKDIDNNQIFTLTINRKGKAKTHYVNITDHSVTVAADTGNETHTLTLVSGGRRNGTQ